MCSENLALGLRIKEWFEHSESSFLEELQRKGWAKTSAGISDPDELAEFLETVASRIGEPFRHKFGVVEKLSPRHAETGNPNSLSGRYSLAPFPLHCDTSHWRVPCRYMFLGCVNPGAIPTSTLLLDTSEIILSPEERTLVQSSVFLIKNGRRSFYSSILSTQRKFIRLDPGCMVAINEESKVAMELYSYVKQKHQLNKISWCIGDVLVIDNWRVLHGRGEQLNTTTDRLLLRVYVQ